MLAMTAVQTGSGQVDRFLEDAFGEQISTSGRSRRLLVRCSASSSRPSQATAQRRCSKALRVFAAEPPQRYTSHAYELVYGIGQARRNCALERMHGKLSQLLDQYVPPRRGVELVPSLARFPTGH